MLVLTRKPGDRIKIGKEIEIVFFRISDGTVRIGIDAPKEMCILRHDAKLLPNGILGLDTPDKLYRQLVAELPGRTKSYSGYLGFTPKPGGGYSVLIEAPMKGAPRAN